MSQQSVACHHTPFCQPKINEAQGVFWRIGHLLDTLRDNLLYAIGILAKNQLRRHVLYARLEAGEKNNRGQPYVASVDAYTFSISLCGATSLIWPFSSL